MTYDNSAVNAYLGGFGAGTSGDTTLARDTTFVDTTSKIACDGNVTSVSLTMFYTDTWPATSAKIKLLREKGAAEYDVIYDQDITDEYNALTSGAVDIMTKTVDWDVLEGDLFAAYIILTIDVARGIRAISLTDGNIKSISGDVTSRTSIEDYTDNAGTTLQFSATGTTTNFLMTSNENPSGGNHANGDIIPLSVPTNDKYYIIMEDVSVPHGESLTINLQRTSSGGASISDRKIVLDFTDYDPDNPSSGDGLIKFTTSTDVVISTQDIIPAEVFSNKGFTFMYWVDMTSDTTSEELFYTNYNQGMGLTNGDIKCVDYHERARTNRTATNFVRAYITQNTGSGASVGKFVVARKPILCIGDSYVSSYNDVFTRLNRVGRNLLTSFSENRYIINGGIQGNKLLVDAIGVVKSIREHWNKRLNSDLDGNIDGSDRQDWVGMRDVVTIFVNGPCINDIVSSANGLTLNEEEQRALSVRLAGDIARMAGEAGFNDSTRITTGGANEVVYVGVCPNTAGIDAEANAEIKRIIDNLNPSIKIYAVLAQMPFVDCSDLGDYLSDGTHLTTEGDQILADRIVAAYENNLIPIGERLNTGIGSTIIKGKI